MSNKVFALTNGVIVGIPSGLYLYKVESPVTGTSKFAWSVNGEAPTDNAESILVAAGYVYIEMPLCKITPTITGDATAVLTQIRR